MSTLVAVAAADTTTTTGTGAVTLSGTAQAITINGVQATTFATAFTLNGTIAYPISNIGYQISDGTNTETGLGTLTSATNLTRDLVLASSNSNRSVNFIAGTKTVVSATTAWNASASTWASVPSQTLPENDVQSGTFVATVNAGTATPVTGTVRYKISGAGQVTLTIPAITQTSVSTTGVTVTGIPSFLAGGLGSVKNVIGLVTNSAAIAVGVYQIAANAAVLGTATATLFQGTAPPASAFTSATGVNGTAACDISYNIF